MTSSSEKGTSPKPESVLGGASQNDGMWPVKDSDLCLRCLLTERRRDTGSLRVTTAFLSALCKALLVWYSAAECAH